MAAYQSSGDAQTS